MADCNGYRHTLNFESETYVTYLASDYLEFHLRLKGLDSSLYFPSSITNCSNKLTGDKVSMKIRLLGKEMDKHFSEQFTEIRSKLDITTTSLKTAFFGDGLVEYTENREEQRNESSWPVFKRFCGVAAGLGALTLGAFFASKS
ncbi:uncharacterized protein LOC106469252 isoform X2 [Limulus polyphemus]|uniref:Uncharacterized protein LOC106469252 isoform X2 n=1 Tax=Limulus polyphemus TaxID=6850 RepID=A0ABM1BMV3_LIMPO|nr:uncharacterized protein LOC106469252 isoform X2 [Limulus polyphemus]